MMKLRFIRNCKCNDNVFSELRLHLLPLLYSTSINDASKVNCSPLSEFFVNYLGIDYNQSITVFAKLPKSLTRATNVSDLKYVENAHCVVHFFKQLRFDHCQIQKLVIRDPRILMLDVDNIIKPKVNLLKELGVSKSDLFEIMLYNCQLLRTQIEPVINAFRTVLVNDKDVIACLKRQTFFEGHPNLLPNVQLLQNLCGVTIDSITKFILRNPRAFLVKTNRLREVVVKVEQKLGIPRNSTMFMHGVMLLICHDEKRLHDKFEIFKSFGWTLFHIATLMRRHPICFASTESMIKRKLDFLMNEVGHSPDYLMIKVSLFTCSVDNRLLPRYRVLQFLKQKGKANGTLLSVSTLSEPRFVKKFVLPFKEVHEIYAQLTGSKVDLLDVERAKGQS